MPVLGLPLLGFPQPGLPTMDNQGTGTRRIQRPQWWTRMPMPLWTAPTTSAMRSHLVRLVAYCASRTHAHLSFPGDSSVATLKPHTVHTSVGATTDASTDATFDGVVSSGDDDAGVDTPVHVHGKCIVCTAACCSTSTIQQQRGIA